MVEIPPCPYDYTYAWVLQREDHSMYTLICRPLTAAERQLKEDLWWTGITGGSLLVFLAFFTLLSGFCKPQAPRRRRVLSNGSITEQEVEV